ncbi:MAG: 50S ribosomal protein L5 [Candidatus Omnitrophica bacterium]|nr:50S ribosomal protein L5 [Candidatus Omnitrophota bacterium]
MKSRLYIQYKEKVVPQLKEKFGYKNIHQVPCLKKIVINMGIGEGSANLEVLEKAMEELAFIAGQKPSIRRAKKSIANFKIRKGMPVGCKVTLRRDTMYEFLDRLVNIALPRVRDFQGIVDSKGFDTRGNYTLGLSEQTIFPEINLDKIKQVQGMDISFVTTAHTRDEVYELLKLFGFPFRRK